MSGRGESSRRKASRRESSRRKAWKRVRPSQIRIGPMTWRVCYNSHKLDAMTCDDEGHHHGSCNGVSGTIYVRGSDPVDVQRDTLLHEVLHAISATYGIEWVKDEERMVSRLAPVLLQVLQANPGLVVALASALGDG